MIDIPFELQHLSKAHNYQSWITDSVSPFLGQRILEVGAGIGNHSVWLPVREKLVITEADESLFAELQKRTKDKFGADTKVKTSLVDLSKDWVRGLRNENIDTVISFNVLEHVADDQKAIDSFHEILKSSQTPGPKRIVNFVPAHMWAHGSIDRTYGHFRRYSHRNFLAILERLNLKPKIYYRYFNLVGLPGWLIMGRVLHRKDIGPAAVSSFERICPWIRGADDFLHEKLRIPFGQSLLFVMEF